MKKYLFYLLMAVAPAGWAQETHGGPVNWMSFVGLLFVLVVLFFPRGLLGFLQRSKA